MVQVGKLKGKLPEELPSAATPPAGDMGEELPGEGEAESPLAAISDEELLAEMEKRGLSSAAAPAAAPTGKALPPL